MPWPPASAGRRRPARHVHAGQHDDRQHHVHHRTGQRDRDATPRRLAVEAARAVLLGQLLVGRLAEHLHVAAERQPGDHVLGLADAAAQDRGAEPDRESLHLDAEPLGDREVPELVTEDAAPEQIPGWDSLGHAELVGALEAEFGLSFDVDEIMDMENVAAIVRIVSEKQGASTG